MTKMRWNVAASTWLAGAVQVQTSYLRGQRGGIQVRAGLVSSRPATAWHSAARIKSLSSSGSDGMSHPRSGLRSKIRLVRKPPLPPTRHPSCAARNPISGISASRRKREREKEKDRESESASRHEACRSRNRLPPLYVAYVTSWLTSDDGP